MRSFGSSFFEPFQPELPMAVVAGKAVRQTESQSDYSALNGRARHSVRAVRRFLADRMRRHCRRRAEGCPPYRRNLNSYKPKPRTPRKGRRTMPARGKPSSPPKCKPSWPREVDRRLLTKGRISGRSQIGEKQRTASGSAVAIAPQTDYGSKELELGKLVRSASAKASPGTGPAGSESPVLIPWLRGPEIGVRIRVQAQI